MRYVIAILCVATIFTVFSQDSFAARKKKKVDWTQTPYGVPVAKIGRGATNIVTAPLDIPVAAYRRVKTSKGVLGKGAAVVTGTVQGVGCGAKRVAAGAAEILTFPMIHDTKRMYTAPLGTSGPIH